MEEFFYSNDRDFDGYLSFEEFIGEESHVEKLLNGWEGLQTGQ